LAPDTVMRLMQLEGNGLTCACVGYARMCMSCVYVCVRVCAECVCADALLDNGLRQ
jgi:hypothetical protein